MSVPDVVELSGLDWGELDDVAHAAVVEVEQRVASWVYARHAASWEDPRPFLAERFGSDAVTRSTKTAPTDLRRYVAYGYGDDGELLLSRRFGPADGEVRDERFWTAAKDGAPIQLMVVPRPGGGRGVAHVLRPIWDMGVLIGVDMRFRDRLSSGGWSRERYGYDSGLVTQIEVERESNERTIRNRFEVRYDQDERVASIAGAPLSGGPLRTLYRRAAPRDVKQALKLVERRLPELIVEWAQRLMPDDDVYCVGIIYSYDEPYDPSPSLALGTESERAGWMSELRGEDLRAMLWHPGEFALLDSMPAELQGDQELTEAAATLEREWRATDDKESVRKLLLRCAKALRAAGTLGFLSKAYGPVVLAVDDELADLESNLKICATREDRARLEAV